MNISTNENILKFQTMKLNHTRKYLLHIARSVSPRHIVELDCYMYVSQIILYFDRTDNGVVLVTLIELNF